MEIKIDVDQRAKQILASLDTMPTWMLHDIARAMDRENQLTVSHVQRQYLSFPKDEAPVAIGCRVISNRLRNSIRASAARIEKDSVVSTIGSDVVYAAMQEFGGDIPAQTITAKNAKALRFQIGDRVVFAKSVKLPARHVEGRHFIERGIQDRLPRYSKAVSDAIVDSWNKKASP